MNTVCTVLYRTPPSAWTSKSAALRYDLHAYLYCWEILLNGVEERVEYQLTRCTFLLIVEG